MKVSDILLLADINVPNNLGVGTKIMFLNEICKQLYREFPFPDEVYPFFTTPYIAFYPFPADCIEDRVSAVQVNGTTYAFRATNEMDIDYSWSIVADMMALSPIPKEVKPAFIFYQPQPNDLTESDLNKQPQFPADFREALVYGISKRIAMALSVPDLKLAGYYSGEMTQLVTLAKQKLHRPKKQVAIYRQWT